MTDTFAADDAALIAQTRAGDAEAFSTLWQRHEGAARRLAATYARNDADRDDLVSVAFERVFTAIRNGGGPDESFRAYLFVTLRRAAAEAAHRRNELPPQGLIDLALEADEAPLDGAERALITHAFESLPDRWQTVLWHTAVEGRAPRELAARLGISPNAAAAMAYRAREKLRQAYLQAHLQQHPRAECEAYVPQLGAYVRGALSARDHGPVEAHVEQCQHCQALLAELQDVNALLLRAMLPVLGGIGFKAVAAAAVATAGAGGAALTVASVGGGSAAAGGAAAGAVGAGAGGAAAASGGGGASAGSTGMLGWFSGSAGPGAQAGAIGGAIAAAAAVVVGALAAAGAFGAKPAPKLATAPPSTTTTTEAPTTSTTALVIPLPVPTTTIAPPASTTTSTTTPRTPTTRTVIIPPGTTVPPPPPTLPPTTTPTTVAPKAVLAMSGHYADNHPGLALNDFRVQNNGDADANGITVVISVDAGSVSGTPAGSWSCTGAAPTITCTYNGAVSPGSATGPLAISAPDANHMTISASAAGAQSVSVGFP